MEKALENTSNGTPQLLRQAPHRNGGRWLGSNSDSVPHSGSHPTQAIYFNTLSLSVPVCKVEMGTSEMEPTTEYRQQRVQRLPWVKGTSSKPAFHSCKTQATLPAGQGCWQEGPGGPQADEATHVRFLKTTRDTTECSLRGQDGSPAGRAPMRKHRGGPPRGQEPGSSHRRWLCSDRSVGWHPE